jgi:Domain of unknown function (DUF397)
VEDTIEPRWRKSSYSGNGGSDCVEAAHSPVGRVAVRDSKDPGGPRLTFAPADWQSFTASVRAGRYDLG